MTNIGRKRFKLSEYVIACFGPFVLLAKKYTGESYARTGSAANARAIGDESVSG